MTTLTVFTPTYNRAYCLGQCYESLVSQTDQDFIWLIIDDGSTDNTRDLVASWIEENKIKIKYHHQENQGMHGGHNTAYSLVETPLNVCIDSDDFMPTGAVATILKQWAFIKDDPNSAGIVGLDAYKDGQIIGTKFPHGVREATLNDLYHKYKVKGDKKLVYKTEIVKKYPKYPIFRGERFVPLGSLYLLIDQDYKLLPINEILCIVEYLPDGSSLNILHQYRRHPKGFRYARVIGMKYGITSAQKFKNAVHYVASCLELKDLKGIFKSPKIVLTILASPFGLGLFIYIHIKTRKASR